MLSGNLQDAKYKLECIRQLQPDNQEVALWIAEVETTIGRTYPLPLTSSIVQESRAIRGDMSEKEIELLLALTLQAVSHCNDTTPSFFADVRYSLGQSTVAMELIVRNLQKKNIYIVALDDPRAGLGTWLIQAIPASKVSVHKLMDKAIFLVLKIRCY